MAKALAIHIQATASCGECAKAFMAREVCRQRRIGIQKSWGRPQNRRCEPFQRELRLYHRQEQPPDQTRKNSIALQLGPGIAWQAAINRGGEETIGQCQMLNHLQDAPTFAERPPVQRLAGSILKRGPHADFGRG